MHIEYNNFLFSLSFTLSLSLLSLPFTLASLFLTWYPELISDPRRSWLLHRRRPPQAVAAPPLLAPPSNRKFQSSLMRTTIDSGNNRLKEFFVARKWCGLSSHRRYRNDTSLLPIVTPKVRTLASSHGKNRMRCCARGCYPRSQTRFSLDSFSFVTHGKFGKKFMLSAIRK